MQIREIMTSNVSTVEPTSSIVEAAQVMKNLNVGAVPVCNGTEPVGIITDRDIAIRNIAENKGVESSVQDFMTSDLVYGTPEMSVDAAAQLMARNQIRRLPVVESGNIVGIVSLGDLAVQSKVDMEAGNALTSISRPNKC